MSMVHLDLTGKEQATVGTGLNLYTYFRAMDWDDIPEAVQKILKVDPVAWNNDGWGRLEAPTAEEVESLAEEVRFAWKNPVGRSQLADRIEKLLLSCELNLDDMEPETVAAIVSARNLLEKMYKEN